MNKTNTLCALIFLAATSFGQRQYTVAAIASPTSDNIMVTWVSDDGSTTFGVLLFDGGALSNCYSVKDGQFTMYPTPGFSCFVRDVNANLQFTGVLSPIAQPGAPNFAGLSLYVNLNGSFEIFGQQIGATVQSKGFNIHGAVAGVAVNGSGNNFGWVYSGGQVTNLPLNFLTSLSTYPSAINDNGDIAGSASPSAPWSANTCQAAIYRNGNVINIGAPSGGAAYANAINSSGQVVGSGQTGPISFNHAPDPSALIPVPFFYDGTTMHAINVPGAQYGGYADVLNDPGEVVGRYYPDNLDGCIGNTCTYTHRAFLLLQRNGRRCGNSLLVNSSSGARVERRVLYQQQRLDSRKSRQRRWKLVSDIPSHSRVTCWEHHEREWPDRGEP